MICWHWSRRRHSSPAQEQRWWFQLCYFLFLPITQGRIKRILSGLCWIWHILFWRAPSPSAPCGHWHRQPRFPEAVGLQVKSFQAEINFQVALQPPAVRSWVTIYHDNINKNKKKSILKRPNAASPASLENMTVYAEVLLGTAQLWLCCSFISHF